MAMPKWATPERRNHLEKLVTAHKGRCLQGHLPCSVLEHFIHRYTQVEIASGPVTSADVRAGRAIAPPCHGVGIVDLAQAVSGGDAPRLRWDANNKALPPAVVNVIGPKRVAVQHEELSDHYGLAEEQAIESWEQDDREERRLDGRQWTYVKGVGLKLLAQTAPTGEVGQFVQFSMGKSHRRPFDPIQRENFIANRPSYYLLGYGVDGRLRRFAKVRVAGTNFILQVDVSESMKPLSQRQSKRRHQQGLGPRTSETLIQEAVQAWWAR